MNAVSSDSVSSPVAKRSASAKKHHARSKSGAEEIPMLGTINVSGKPGTTSTSFAAIEGVSGPATARASTRSTKSHSRLDKEKDKEAAKIAKEDKEKEKEASKVAKEQSRTDKDKHHHKKRDKA